MDVAASRKLARHADGRMPADPHAFFVYLLALESSNRCLVHHHIAALQ